MSPKWKYALGATTIGLIIGGTVYAIIKAKQAEKQEEEEITLDEARAIVASRKSLMGEDIEDIDDEEETVVVSKKIINSEPRKVQAVKYLDDEPEMEEGMEEIFEDDYPDVDEDTPSPYIVEPLSNFMYIEGDIDPKEDKELRYPPNSVEAKHQFIRMELAEWEPNNDAYRILLTLFEVPFVPMNEGDELLRTQVIDYKVQFFGYNSKWNKEVSYADIMLHYARLAEFNCGESVSYWLETFLQFNEFNWDSTNREIDTLLLRLNSHSYFNEERMTFGLFGLSRESMDQAIRIANQNIDRSVTYEIEFNEFLKSCI